MSEENLNLHEFTSHSKCVQLKCNCQDRSKFRFRKREHGTKTKCYISTYVFVLILYLLAFSCILALCDYKDQISIYLFFELLSHVVYYLCFYTC